MHFFIKFNKEIPENLIKKYQTQHYIEVKHNTIYIIYND